MVLGAVVDDGTNVLVKLVRLMLNGRLVALELRLSLANRLALCLQLLTLLDELVDKDLTALNRLGRPSFRARLDRLL